MTTEPGPGAGRPAGTEPAGGSGWTAGRDGWPGTGWPDPASDRRPSGPPPGGPYPAPTAASREQATRAFSAVGTAPPAGGATRTAPRPPDVRPATAAERRAGPRRARLVLRRLDPWSVLKMTLALSLCGVVIATLAVAVLYAVLSGLGVFDSVAKFLDTVTDASAGNSTRHDFRASLVVGGAAGVFAVGALLTTALATLGAFIYNLCGSLVGGLEVTLTERGAP